MSPLPAQFLLNYHSVPLQLGFNVSGFLDLRTGLQTPSASVFVFKNHVETEAFKAMPHGFNSEVSYSDWDLEQALDKTIILPLFWSLLSLLIPHSRNLAE